ncbi:uncharacterized protein LACBIDRAFT_321471 [Laccaria bicolor S238N-H82]|uniref:Predicted protein n=1 Tax=Laccaria bicolor (strain S238N-H82 / ATCC MYA-4686) TaxID=486041 RepID=B0CT06_LACBS|nr:uncharacterized protein LACBIDRAFT_321471 [Laccaria bicolor S238N-H82]EDR14421.1 predicted protein [Laccaria bicolor S238N-H82]|eukprot:XP_001874980.1 predicted protein [Laccaria bicolor S238N-H82]
MNASQCVACWQCFWPPLGPVERRIGVKKGRGKVDWYEDEAGPVPSSKSAPGEEDLFGDRYVFELARMDRMGRVFSWRDVAKPTYHLKSVIAYIPSVGSHKWLPPLS